MKELRKKRAEESLHPVNHFRHNIDELFKNFFGDIKSSSLYKSDFTPKINLSEDSTHVYVKAEIPGATKSDIEVSIQERIITIKGEKKEEQTSGDPKKTYIKESIYGAFERTFSLPSDVDSTQAKASFKDGVLSIEIPKIQIQDTTKKITIE